MDRYLSDPFKKKAIHSAIAEYFLGRRFVGERNFAKFIYLVIYLFSYLFIYLFIYVMFKKRAGVFYRA